MLSARGTAVRLLAGAWLGLCALAAPSRAGDWPQWGGQDGRNMVSDEKGIPDSFDPGKKGAGGSYDLSTARNVKWAARLGTEAYASPVVCGGKVFVGTNNGQPRDPKYSGDRSVLMCFDEASGKLLWQLAVPKIPEQGPVNMDFGRGGITSTAAVEGDRVYVVTNRCEVLCLDANGLANGNEGPFQDEGFYLAPPAAMKLYPALEKGARGLLAKPGQHIFDVTPAKQPVKLGPQDADIVWRYDMLNEIPAWPQDACSCSILIHGDLLYVSTCNGVDKSHRNVPALHSPTLIALDKKTGKLAAADDAHLGERILHGTWSSPSLGQVAGAFQVYFGGPDGVCYAFDPQPAPVPSGAGVLKKLWWFDCSPPAARFKDRWSAQYPSRTSASEIIGTPVFYKNRVYVTVGQDPRHGVAAGMLSCIDATQSGDVTQRGRLWQYDKISRSLSTVSIADGLLYVADVAGAVHCLDAETGQVFWVHKTDGSIWGSTLAVDGKVFVGNAKGNLYVFAAGKQPKPPHTIALGAPIYATPCVANGVLYVATSTYLFAVQKKD